MDEGFEIPIGGDLAPLNEAFEKVIETIAALGDKIAGALNKANAVIAATTSEINKVNVAAGETVGSANALAEAIATTGQRIAAAVQVGSNLGTTMMGMQSAFHMAGKASKVLAGINLASALSSWATKAGGIRAAFSKIPSILSDIVKNPIFKKIAIGAAAAVVSIIAIRTAWSTVSAGAKLMGSVVMGVLRGIRAAGAATASALKGIASMPGKMLGAIPGLPIGGLLGAAGATALLVTQLKGASDSAAVFEDLRVSVEHFTGSTEAAKTLLEDLAGFAIKTPFETVDVQQTAAGLLGAGIREDVAGITKDLAAMSRNGQELGQLGDALGKGFAKGKFQTEEVNKFLERGINLQPALQAQTGLTGDAFRKAVEAGLSFSTVTAAIRSMSSEGGQFFGLLERRSQTFTGLISTLQSAWTDLRKAFGIPFNDAIKPILQAGIEKLTALMGKAKELGERVGRAITIAFVAVRDGKAAQLFGAVLKLGMATAVHTLMTGVRAAVAFLGAALPPIFAMATSKLSDPMFWDGLFNIIKALGDSLAATIREAFPGADEQMIDAQKALARTEFSLGAKQLGEAGDGKNLSSVLTDALSKGNAASKYITFTEGIRGSAEMASAREHLVKFFASLKSETDKLQAKTAAATMLANSKSLKSEHPLFKRQLANEAAKKEKKDKETKLMGTRLGILSTSQGRVGGGGAFGFNFSSLASIAQKQAKLLQDIKENTKPTQNNTSIPTI